MIDNKHWGRDVGTDCTPQDYSKIRQLVTKSLEQSSPFPRHELLPIQKLSVASCVALGFRCLFDDMGLGKTAQSLAMDTLEGHKNTLIFCPNNIKTVWEFELYKFLNVQTHEIYIGKGSDLTHLPDKIAKKYRYIIFNYEALISAAKTHRIIPSVFRVCTHHILDEAHYFRNALSRRYMAYLHFLTSQKPQTVKSLTILTGTPVDRSIVELWPYFTLLDHNPRVPGQPFRKFFGNYSVFSCRYAETRGINQWRGYKEQMLPEIFNMMGPRFTQRKIEEVVELPKLNKYTIDIPNKHLPNIDMDDSIKRFKKAFALIHKSTKMAKAFDDGLESDDSFMRITQKLRCDIAKAKAPLSFETAKEYRKFTNKPLLIFFEFITPLLIFEKHATMANYKTLNVYGKGMHNADREHNLAQFKEERHDFLLATYGVLSEGVNLQQFNCLILNDLPWQPLTINQTIRRVWRIGQKQECYVISMMCKADSVVLNTVTNKQTMVSKIENMFSLKKREWGLV